MYYQRMVGTYSKLSAKERLQLVMAAFARNDIEEYRRLLESLPSGGANTQFYRSERAFAEAVRYAAVPLAMYLGRLALLRALPDTLQLLHILDGGLKDSEDTATVLVAIQHDLVQYADRLEPLCRQVLTVLERFCQLVAAVPAAVALNLYAELVACQLAECELEPYPEGPAPATIDADVVELIRVFRLWV